ncbi:MAG: amidohydrolase family protein [Desulfocapsaceae bacterium]|nr:amidohydrolase family protein [Desulfocapsaceae bacterium]
MLTPNMPSLNDPEGNAVPEGLPTVIDAHVHIFPDPVFTAVRNWFDEHGWRIRYRLSTEEIFSFLQKRGIYHVVALQYAHKPGIARQLNSYMAEQCRTFPDLVCGMATVFPGEDQDIIILAEAFAQGLSGLKLHSHVQCFDMNSEAMERIYECCQEHAKPIIMHVGQEPKSSAYQCDPYELCNVNKLEAVICSFPDLKVCVPHLGVGETAQYKKLIEKYDNLWLDTTMVITDYFPFDQKIDLLEYRPDRIMYGSDFPNIPYAWDRELKELRSANLPDKLLEMITFGNAVDFYNLQK